MKGMVVTRVSYAFWIMALINLKHTPGHLIQGVSLDRGPHSWLVGGEEAGAVMSFSIEVAQRALSASEEKPALITSDSADAMGNVLLITPECYLFCQ
ncbi:hypothetical protein llap_21693 [Limosa lapponica baueri]|uniref:Uncharacterized protein n=1 Tax=Limosa lapponica baueri TaxID=1758121 RepID=A0A2I0T2H8_LIMLA|nr:hypothetical protein llap_21693 [Limosa lapponica baueri]